MGSNTRAALVFAAMSPPQPWPCCFCGEDVSIALVAVGRGGNGDSFTLHHVDGDHDNNDPANWAPAHTRCHARHHNRVDPGVGWKPGNTGNRGGPHSEETRRRISRALTGRSPSAATRERLSLAGKASQRLRDVRDRRCLDCPITTNARSMGRHLKASGHTGYEIIAV